MWKAGTSKVVAPAWVGLGLMGWPCEQVLNVPIACRWYGPGKPSNWLLTEGGFTPTTSMVGSGEKLGTNPWIGQLACCRLCRESFFSGAVALPIAVDDFVKGYHVRGLPAESMQWAYVDWRGKRMCHIGRIFPCRVYINLNRHDSRIWVTACLWQSSRRQLNGMVDGLNWNCDALL
jgi:hypothetical protein